jgi:hypothetical protein
MSDVKDFNSLIPWGSSIVLFLYCIITPLYAAPVEPTFGFEPWWVPSNIQGNGGELDLESFDHTHPVFLPEYPRYNGYPPLDASDSFVNSYGFNNGTYGDATSNTKSVSNTEYIITPEPATWMLMGLGFVVMKKRNRT